MGFLMQDRAVSEGRQNKEILELNERNLNLQANVAELELKTRTQQEHIYDLKEQVTHGQAEHKLKAAQFEGRFKSTAQPVAGLSSSNWELWILHLRKLQLRNCLKGYSLLCHNNGYSYQTLMIGRVLEVSLDTWLLSVWYILLSVFFFHRTLKCFYFRTSADGETEDKGVN